MRTRVYRGWVIGGVKDANPQKKILNAESRKNKEKASNNEKIRQAPKKISESRRTAKINSESRQAAKINS